MIDKARNYVENLAVSLIGGRLIFLDCEGDMLTDFNLDRPLFECVEGRFGDPMLNLRTSVALSSNPVVKKGTPFMFELYDGNGDLRIKHFTETFLSWQLEYLELGDTIVLNRE